MKRTVVYLAGLVYRLLLYLYPADFREEFGEEMAAVFVEALSAAAQKNFPALFILALRELYDYPLSLLRQHWRAFEENPMSDTPKPIVFLAALVVFGVAWRVFAGILWGPSLLDNWGLVMFVIAYWPFVLAFIVAFGWLFAAVFTKRIYRINDSVWPAAGLLTLVVLIWPGAFFENPATFRHNLFISWVLVIAAVLLNSGMGLYAVGQDRTGRERVGWSGRRLPPNGRAVIMLGLSLVLLIKALHNWYWLLIWDSTYDSLDFLWLFFPVSAALIAGISLFFSLRNRTKRAGLTYLLLVPALLIGVYNVTRQVDFRQLTEERAARTSRSVEAFYSREGRYPESLEALTPWYIPSVPEPVIMYGQRWCYDSGIDYYRLGYVYREHWSDPRLSGKLYNAAGDISNLEPLCIKEVTALQEQYPDYPYEYWMANE